MALNAYRGLPPGELSAQQIGSQKVVISEFGDGVMGTVVGQRAGFVMPWAGNLGSWYILSTSIDSSGNVIPVPVSVTIRGWHKPWSSSTYTDVTAGFHPSVSAAAQATGSNAGWSVSAVNVADHWEWEILSLSGGGSKLYLAQLITKV